MNAGPRDDAWTLPAEKPPSRAFKFAFDQRTDTLLVWPVEGAGDGFPSHGEQLKAHWDRLPAADDTLGRLSVETDSDSRPALRVVVYGEHVLSGELEERLEEAVGSLLRQGEGC